MYDIYCHCKHSELCIVKRIIILYSFSYQLVMQFMRTCMYFSIVIYS